jgi:hypothetical protein
MGRLFPAGVMNDGTVAVDETKLAGMTAFASVDATHTWIMNSPRVRHLIVTFLCNGRLD